MLDTLLDFAARYSVALVVALAIALYVLLPGLRDLINKRWECTNARHAARLEVNKDYFNRRIQAYLDLWRETMQVSRALLNAGNMTTNDTWENARSEVRELKNFLWDNRPLLSWGVFEVIEEVDQICDHFSARGLGADGRPEYAIWRQLNSRIGRVQMRLLMAITRDLEETGLASLVDNTAGPHILGYDPRQRDSLDARASVELLVDDLIAFVARGEQRLPFVGESVVRQHFQTPNSIDLGSVIERACQDGHVERWTATGRDGGPCPALRVNPHSRHVADLLGEEAAVVLASRTDPALQSPAAADGDLDSCVARLVTFVVRGQRRMPFVATGLVRRELTLPAQVDFQDVLRASVSRGLLDQYEHRMGDGTTRSALRVNLSVKIEELGAVVGPELAAGAFAERGDAAALAVDAGPDGT